MGTITKPFRKLESISKLEKALKYAMPSTAHQKIKLDRFLRLKEDIGLAQRRIKSATEP